MKGKFVFTLQGVQAGRLILGLVSWGLAILLLPLMGRAQPSEHVLGQPIPTISPETYHQVLDFIFAPKDKSERVVTFSLNIRIAPSFRPEAQMNLTLLKDRTTRADYIVAEKNVYYASNNLLQSTGESRAEEVARRTPVKRYELNVSPALLMKWQRGFMESMGRTAFVLEGDAKTSRLGRPETITLDGDSYEVWYGQFPPDTKIHISFGESPTPTPLEKWAKAVYSTAAKMALQSNQ